ncbi:hypothetical protein KAU15_00535, partial [candidate division WOR-3 bacterium]|nr:hypothetical protein [candidate division WOR-3 bacterium]
MKKLFFLILLIVYIGIHAGIIEKSFSFDEKHLKIQKENGYDYITFKECFNPRNLGLPFVPCKTVKFVIPPSAVITNIKVISSSSSILSGTYNIYPAQKPVPVSFNVENEFILPEKTIYESDNLYPGKLIELLPIGNKAGFRIAQINLFPIQYQPKQKKLIFNSSITIRIEFQEGVCQVKRLSDKQIQIFGKEIKMIVDNPEDVEHYAPRVSSYGLLITPYPIEGVEIKGETKTVPIPRIESEIRILESKTMKIPQHEERINKLKREKIKNTISDFVICKPWIEAVHPILKRIVRSKGIVVNSYISSPHPYFNSMNNYYYIYGPPENNRMCVHFDTLNIESGYDTIYVYDNNGILINTYSGVYGPTWSSWGDGPTFTIKIKTDVSVTRYGFDVDYIQVGGSCSYENSLHPYANNTNESIDMYGPLNDWIGRVCFHYDSIHAESGYDYVYCYDIDNTTILNTWSGQYDNVWSNWSTYNSSYITQIHERTNLESDGSVTEYGWLVNYFNFNRGHQVESAHNYPNNANQTYYVYGPQDEGSIQMRLHFSKLYTESGYDTVYVYDGKDNLMNIYTGDLGTDFWTSWGDSNFVKIVLKSDNSVTRWGFKCDQYEWQAAGQPNLTYYQPTGWSSPLVCAINRDTDTTAITSDTLIAGDSSFVSWAMINSGTADATDTIYWYLYIDDSYLAGWYSVGLQQGYYTYVRGYGFIESIAG